jgi:hypothetical protein
MFNITLFFRVIDLIYVANGASIIPRHLHELMSVVPKPSIGLDSIVELENPAMPLCIEAYRVENPESTR